MAVVHGIDVSAYQNVAYATVAKHVDFLIVKCTEGTHTTSSAWTKHWAGAKSAHLLRGSYHVAHPENSGAVTEANHYADVLRAGGFRPGFDLPPVLDIEPGTVKAGVSRSAITAWATAFLDHLDAALGLTGANRAGLYVGDSIASAVNVAAILAGFRPFWRGGYGNTIPTAVPAGCAFYQRVVKSSLIPGVTGSATVDVDVADSATLRRLAPSFYGVTPKPTVENGDVMPTVSEIWTAKVIPNRDTPSGPATTNATPAGVLSNIEATQDVMYRNQAALLAQVGGLGKALEALSSLVAAGTSVDPTQLAAAVRQAAHDGAQEALAQAVQVDVSFENKTQ